MTPNVMAFLSGALAAGVAIDAFCGWPVMTTRARRWYVGWIAALGLHAAAWGWVAHG